MAQQSSKYSSKRRWSVAHLIKMNGFICSNKVILFTRPHIQTFKQDQQTIAVEQLGKDK